MSAPRKTRKYVLGLAKLRALGITGLRSPSAERVYSLLTTKRHAWDPETGWYEVSAHATGTVSVRLIGAIDDVVGMATKFGWKGELRPGDAGTWRLYCKVPSGVPAQTNVSAPARRSARRVAR
jgi:hypothetical protein